jgi:hypothetical protein
VIFFFFFFLDATPAAPASLPPKPVPPPVAAPPPPPAQLGIAGSAVVSTASSSADQVLVLAVAPLGGQITPLAPHYSPISTIDDGAGDSADASPKSLAGELTFPSCFYPSLSCTLLFDVDKGVGTCPLSPRSDARLTSAMGAFPHHPSYDGTLLSSGNVVSATLNNFFLVFSPHRCLFCYRASDFKSVAAGSDGRTIEGAY